jgi:hypothetical protein
MKPREWHKYRPVLGNALERRLALNARAPMVPALVGILHHQGLPARGSHGATAQINQAFDSFTKDYLQTEQTYLQTNGTTDVFKTFTAQRVNTLAQDLTRILVHVPGSTSRAHGKPPALQTFLENRITSAQTNGSLLQALDAAIPPSGTTGTTLDLYHATQLNAINAARTATTNTVVILAVGAFPSNSHGK